MVRMYVMLKKDKFYLLFVAGSVQDTAASLSWLVVMQYSNNVSVSYIHH